MVRIRSVSAEGTQVAVLVIDFNDQTPTIWEKDTTVGTVIVADLYTEGKDPIPRIYCDICYVHPSFPTLDVRAKRRIDPEGWKDRPITFLVDFDPAIPQKYRDYILRGGRNMTRALVLANEYLVRPRSKRYPTPA